jgi:hypothetical protein
MWFCVIERNSVIPNDVNQPGRTLQTEENNVYYRVGNKNPAYQMLT